MSTEGTHRHENREGFREEDVMKEKAVVKDWDNNHLGERRFGRERGQAWVF